MGEVWETDTPRVVELHRTTMGPTLRAITDEVAVTYVVFIPIIVNGQLHGIIRIENRDTPFVEEVVSRCRALGNVIELALGNAIAHQDLEMQANTDPLTGVVQSPGPRALPRG